MWPPSIDGERHKLRSVAVLEKAAFRMLTTGKCLTRASSFKAAKESCQPGISRVYNDPCSTWCKKLLIRHGEKSVTSMTLYLLCNLVHLAAHLLATFPLSSATARM